MFSGNSHYRDYIPKQTTGGAVTHFTADNEKSIGEFSTKLNS